PLVSGEQVIDARTDDAGNHDGDDDPAEFLGFASGAYPPGLGDLDGDEHPDGKHEAVGVKRERAEVHDAVLRARDERHGHGADGRAGGSSRTRQDADVLRVSLARASGVVAVTVALGMVAAGCDVPAPLPKPGGGVAAVSGPTVAGCPAFPANNAWNQK